MTEKKKRNIIIGLLCGVLLLMVVGYAAFNSVLKIKGTSNISSNWDIKITNITAKNMTGTAKDIPYDAENQTDGTRIDLENPLSATFKTELETPGDSIEYDITVSNEGTINAKLETINLIDTNNGAIRFEARGLEEGDSLKTGENKILTVKVEYLNGAILDENNMSSTLKVELTFSQANVDKDGIAYPDDNAAGVLRGKAVTTGDGLYEDEYEAGRYVYRGTNPDNYITFNNELWRILAVETDGTLKIMRKDSIGNRQFEASYVRSASYCNVSSYGCNVWGSSTTMLDAFGANINVMTYKVGGTAYELPTEESQTAKYLNNEYYSTLDSNAQSQIDNHLWNVGPVDPDKLLDVSLQEEKNYKWIGNIGLINPTDYIKASLNTSCTIITNGSSNTQCKEINYLFTGNSYWTISPHSSTDSGDLWAVTNYGNTAGNNGGAITNLGIYPTLYLKADITLSGEGTEDKPYTIN